MMKKLKIIIFMVILCSMALYGSATAQTLEDKIRALEQELKELKEELKSTVQREKEKASVEPQIKASQAEKKVIATDQAEKVETQRYEELLDRVKIGGYGSFRFEANSLNELRNTFTLRRLVLTTDAQIAPRLKFISELEFERFRELELEREIEPTAGGLRVMQAVEGTNESEIALEQAYLQFELNKWLKLRGGALLVPLGRFNLNHDDNRWNLPRRSLVDRGVPVLPSTAAWGELGIGFAGDTEIGKQGRLGYEIYIMNGVTLDAEVETVIQTRDPRRDKLEGEVELRPSTGTFANDLKEAKAIAGRLVYSPKLGYELAASAYFGQYTPDFLPDENLSAAGLDGLATFGPFELEGEYILTHFGGVRRVARGFAEVVRDRSSAVPSSASPNFEAEVEFELANLASTKHGYWLEGRYSFWPRSLSNTFLGRGFENPKLVLTARGEQVWLNDLVNRVDFAGGRLTAFETQDRRIDRLTLGLAYRPVPLVAFQLAYEFTQSDNGSLLGLTNFLPAQADEEQAHALLFGAAFGF